MNTKPHDGADATTQPQQRTYRQEVLQEFLLPPRPACDKQVVAVRMS